jgi:hypothetical protein
VPRRQAAILIGQSVPPPLLEWHSERLKLSPLYIRTGRVGVCYKYKEIWLKADDKIVNSQKVLYFLCETPLSSRAHFSA